MIHLLFFNLHTRPPSYEVFTALAKVFVGAVDGRSAMVLTSLPKFFNTDVRLQCYLRIRPHHD